VRCQARTATSDKCLRDRIRGFHERRTNSIARVSGSRAVAACTATAAITSPVASRTGTATQATPTTYSSLSTA